MRKQRFITLAALMMVAINFLAQGPAAYAASKSMEVVGTVYELDKDSHYEIATDVAAPGAEALGAFSLSGSVKADGKVGSFVSYDVREGTVSLSYSFDEAILDAPKEEWHLIDDKSKEVNGIQLEKNIQSGALILQTSLDGETWTEDVLMQDIFTDATELTVPFYTTKYIQQQNGCYFRLIVAYQMERKAGDHKILFVNVDDKEYKKVAEVYELYLHDTSSAGTGTTSLDVQPRKELGKTVKTDKDSGFTGGETIEPNDPHFGWDIGTFVVNGYTQETKEDDTPVFLKKVGDKVTLWFQLEQKDLDCLNGNETLSIYEDANGCDEEFGISQTNFKRGTLIIRYTNAEGNSEKPVIYTDFLAAAATASADTKAVLFEEGDYEVSLDYVIQNNPRHIGPVSILPGQSDYKISFSFKVRNGNCMAYPMDAATGSELEDHAITTNGFRLDMAKSRYLAVTVQQSRLKTNADGQISTDVRANEPAKDGEIYTDEGIYTFTVKNQYTDESTTKTIYVGTDKYLTALSKYAISVDELNDRLRDGAVVLDDGTIQMPGEGVLPEPAPEPTPEPTPSPAPLPVSADMSGGTEMTNTTGGPVSAAWPLMIFGIVAAMVTGFVICFVAVIRRKRTRLKVTSAGQSVTFDGYVAVNHYDGALHISDEDEINEDGDV